MDVKKLLSRYKTLKGERSGWESLWQKTSDYVSPVPVDISAQSNRSGPGKKVNVVDTTAREAMSQLAHALNGTLTNPSTSWFRATIADANLASNPNVRVWLDQMADITNHYLQQSNFCEAMIEAWQDLLTYGTAGLLIEEDDLDLISFSARNVSEIVISENHLGRVDTVFRKCRMTALQAFQRFGKSITKEMLKALDTNPDQSFSVIHAILPRNERDPGKIDKKNKKFASIWIDERSETVLSEGGFDEFPMPVVRWDKKSGDVYGSSPSIKVLPDILYLNKLEETSLMAKQIATAPPMLIDDDSLLSDVKWEPFAKIYKRANSRGGAGIQVLNPQINAQMADSAVADRREIIKRAFFGDVVINYDPQYTTAEGIRQNAEERERVLSSVLGRPQSELLEPLVSRVFAILWRAKVYPPLPKELQDGADWRPVWTSPLARKQEERKADSITKALNLIGMVAQIGGQPVAQELLARFNPDALSLQIAEIYGVPRTIIKTDYEIQTERQAAQQAQEQQAQTQQLIQGGQALAQMESQTQNSNGFVGTLMKSLGGQGPQG